MKTGFKFPSGKTVADLAKEYGKTKVYIYHLMKQGCNEDEIIRILSHKSIKQICQDRNVSYTMVYKRLNKGMSLEEALKTPPTPFGQRNETCVVKYRYKGKPISKLVSFGAYLRILRAFKAGKGTIEELTEKELNK